MTSSKRRNEWLAWAALAAAVLAAIFILPPQHGLTAGKVVDKIHYEATGVAWPVCERWFLALQDDSGHSGRIEVTRELWDTAVVGGRWPQ